MAIVFGSIVLLLVLVLILKGAFKIAIWVQRKHPENPIWGSVLGIASGAVFTYAVIRLFISAF